MTSGKVNKKDCSSCICLHCENKCMVSMCMAEIAETKYYDLAIENCYAEECIHFLQKEVSG